MLCGHLVITERTEISAGDRRRKRPCHSRYGPVWKTVTVLKHIYRMLWHRLMLALSGPAPHWNVIAHSNPFENIVVWFVHRSLNSQTLPVAMLPAVCNYRIIIKT